MEIINLGVADDLPPVDWSAVVGKIESGSPPDRDAVNSRSSWLATINADGSAHVTAVGAVWLDGTFWFQTSEKTRKGSNVARDPRCSVAISVPDADVVLEGDAVRVTDLDALRRVAKIWADGGWPAEVDESGPGITDLDRAMRDGYSTYRGLGIGLPGARRLMDQFDIATEVGKGTTVTMTKWRG